MTKKKKQKIEEPSKNYLKCCVCRAPKNRKLFPTRSLEDWGKDCACPFNCHKKV